MTGVERLRQLAKQRDTITVPAVHGTYCAGYVAATGDMCKQLSDIADQIEREQDAMVADSPYDAILPDDREAIAWVRAHGGLDHVKAEWRSRVPYDKHERARQRLLDHIAECETALGRRRRSIEELGKTIEFFQLNNSNFRHLLADVAERLGFTRYGDDYEPEDLLDALDRRLMPESCEWPRYESGELVEVGDEVSVTVHNEDGDFERSVAADSISFDEHGVIIGDPCHAVSLLSGERVRRPESKCRDCAHWQKDPTADKMGVCWFFYHEHEGQDCYPARLGDIGACEEFMPRTRALAERERGE